jgi:hypothetical protein
MSEFDVSVECDAPVAPVRTKKVVGAQAPSPCVVSCWHLQVSEV